MVREIKEDTDLQRQLPPRCKGRTVRTRAATAEEPEVLEDLTEEWKETLKMAQEEDAVITLSHSGRIGPHGRILHQNQRKSRIYGPGGPVLKRWTN